LLDPAASDSAIKSSGYYLEAIGERYHQFRAECTRSRVETHHCTNHP
jgi:hypothetical protein